MLSRGKQRIKNIIPALSGVVTGSLLLVILIKGYFFDLPIHSDYSLIILLFVLVCITLFCMHALESYKTKFKELFYFGCQMMVSTFVTVNVIAFFSAKVDIYLNVFSVLVYSLLSLVVVTLSSVVVYYIKGKENSSETEFIDD
jgi:hypothetical protein